MRNIIWFLAIVFLLIIQAGVFLPLHITSVSLILIVTALAALLSDFDQGLIIVLLGGLTLDIISSSLDGIVSISLILVFLILHLILNEFLSREPNQLIIFATVAGATILFFGTFMIFDQTPDIAYQLTVKLPIALIWNIIFAYPIYLYYTWIQNLVSKLPSNEEPIRS
jgi:hypothetical protein